MTVAAAAATLFIVAVAFLSPLLAPHTPFDPATLSLSDGLKPPVLIMVRHVLPNVTGPVLVIATINLGLAIITEATLSFLGVGLPSTEPSLGTLIRLGNEVLQSGDWWITVFPGVTLAALVLAVNLLGDWLRDALNPKLR